VTVIEREPEKLGLGGQIGVAANAASGLERIGLGEIVERYCVPTQRLEYVNWRGRRLTYMPIAEVAQELGTRTYIALRADVQLALYHALEPYGVVRLGAECVGFAQDADGVTVNLAGGGQERAAAVIGADGLRSVVRAGLDGHVPRYAGYGAWRAVISMDSPPLQPGFGRQTLGRGRTFGVFALREDRVYWWASARGEEGTGVSRAGAKADVLALFGNGPQYVREVIEATPEKAILRNDIYDRPPVERWGRGRVTVIGDAAHAATPNTGEGGSQALLDGVVLGEALAGAGDLRDGAAIERALRAFEAEAIPRTSEVIKRSAEIGNFLHFDNPVMCLIRDQIAYRATPMRVWRKRAAMYLEANVADQAPVAGRAGSAGS
jgi:2-polyprenyl-6-methoxyphenol hydroxylase-like FAD-dependent oxidoreductase